MHAEHAHTSPKHRAHTHPRHTMHTTLHTPQVVCMLITARPMNQNKSTIIKMLAERRMIPESVSASGLCFTGRQLILCSEPKGRMGGVVTTGVFGRDVVPDRGMVRGGWLGARESKAVLAQSGMDGPAAGGEDGGENCGVCAWLRYSA